MKYEKIGPVEVIIGENKSRVPFSTSVVIKGDEHSTIIDCGAGYMAFKHIKKEHNVKDIYLTHHHIDHMWGAHYFPEAKTYINHLDYKKISSLEEIAKSEAILALNKGVDWWNQDRKKLEQLTDIRINRSLQVSDVYEYNKSIHMSGQDVMMIHAPGHTEGFCCPYIINQGILFIGDIDLTSFGPYYSDRDSDIDSFIASAHQTLEVDASYFITSHQKGVVRKDEYKSQLLAYLDIIERREEKIKQHIKSGNKPVDLVGLEVFYYSYQMEKSLSLMKSEKVGIAKHLQRLIKHGEPLEEYYEEYIKSHHLNKEYLSNKIAPTLTSSSKSFI
ncbi:MBL fold metallo-hydrolase [Bacillus massiliigorillae]|uniref:MBL fold metallo-hydrolase n=1 Tax=Bacillus massiliigorillae TaxID=1243664 RepID=UPI0003AAC1B9|nr:MBL fold metallo-hydrolase [Bacillus massiliigorillae]